MDAPRPSPFCAQADFRGQADNCHLHTPFTPHLHVKIITPVKSNFTQLKTLVKKPKLAWSHFKLLTLNLDGAVTAARRQLCAPEPSPPTVRGRSHWPCPLYSHFSTRRTSTDPAPTARRTTPPTTRCHRRGGGGRTLFWSPTNRSAVTVALPSGPRARIAERCLGLFRH